jgi:REP element-mobilizing transposase RayT
MLHENYRKEVFKYIAGIINNMGMKSMAVNGVADHVHIFCGFNPTIRISDSVRDIKKSSTEFIKEKKFINQKFNWQEGYGVFTYSASQVDSVIKYILSQEEHHKAKSFSEEYFEFLNKFQIEYDEKYVLG